MFDPRYVTRNFPVTRHGWLALHDEAVIAPDLPIVDAHHHLWDVAGSPYLHGDLRADIGTGHAIRATVFVECRARYRGDGPAALRPVGETAFAAAQAQAFAGAACAPCAAIVGWADLLLGDEVQAVLEQHVEAGRGRFRGLRLRAAWHEHPALGAPGESRPGLLLDPSVERAVKRLAALGLSLDVWAFHTQLAEVGRLAAMCPDATLVLNHCGGPLGIGPFAGRRDEVYRVWRSHMAALAQHDNIVVKLGGLGMPRIGFDFAAAAAPPPSQTLAAAWRPYVETCIEAFGTARCMFESNFPVDKGSGSYRVLWNAFKRIAAAYSPGEQAALFGRTAAATYRLAG